LKELDTELTEQNRILRQVMRLGTIALYAVCQPGGVLIGYEVIRIRRLPAQTVFGREYPEREAYPSNEQWGQLAWSWRAIDREKAFIQFDNLVIEYGSKYPGDETQ
jgi:hypothetical protein